MGFTRREVERARQSAAFMRIKELLILLESLMGVAMRVAVNNRGTHERRCDHDVRPNIDD
jgi:hypothetical protein